MRPPAVAATVARRDVGRLVRGRVRTVYPAPVDKRLVDDHLGSGGRRARRHHDGRGPALSGPGAVVDDGHALIGPARVVVAGGRPVVANIPRDGLDEMGAAGTVAGRRDPEGIGLASVAVGMDPYLGRLIGARDAGHVGDRREGPSSCWMRRGTPSRELESKWCRTGYVLSLEDLAWADKRQAEW